MRMEGGIVKMAREGKIDEPFLLLLEANEDQARNAGVMQTAEVMKRLRTRAMEEKDKQASSKEVRLIRKLLRTDEAKDREAILEDAFTPRETLLVSCVLFVCFVVDYSMNVHDKSNRSLWSIFHSAWDSAQE